MSVGLMTARDDALDLVIGATVLGVRAGAVTARAARRCGRVAAAVPVAGRPVRAAADRMAADGRRARHEGRRALDLAIDRAVKEILEHPRTLLLAEQVVDSRLAVDLTDHVLRGVAVQHVIEHLAGSPELRRVISEQSAGMAEQTLEGVRERSIRLDDAAERAVRGWLRRPRPQVS